MRQAAVVLGGKWHYLAKYGAPHAEERYHRTITNRLANGRRMPGRPELFVGELVLVYWRYASARYVHEDGKPKKELAAIRAPLCPVKRLSGSIRVEDLGPRAPAWPEPRPQPSWGSPPTDDDTLGHQPQRACREVYQARDPTETRLHRRPPARPSAGLALPSSTPAAGAGGRLAVLKTFVDVMLRSIDNTVGVVWLILYRDTKPNGLACTSQTDIARRARVSVSSAYRALRRLRRLGLLIVVRKGRLNVGASVYQFLAVTATSQLTEAG